MILWFSEILEGESESIGDEKHFFEYFYVFSREFRHHRMKIKQNQKMHFLIEILIFLMEMLIFDKQNHLILDLRRPSDHIFRG